MFHAIIDIGSSTIRMAVYDIKSKRVELILKNKHAIGLAAYVCANVMQREGIDKVIEIIKDYKSFLEDFEITNIIAFTTAAIRNSMNANEVIEEISRKAGIKIFLMSGESEATFGFIGATHDFLDDKGVLVDIGGGSTEIVYFDNRKIKKRKSFQIGSLSLRTKYMGRHFLPSRNECIEMYKEVRNNLNETGDLQGSTQMQIYGIGGTFKSTMNLYNALYKLPRENVMMKLQLIKDILRRFLRDQKLTMREKILLMRAVPEKLHTLIPGLIIADVLVEQIGGSDIIYSNSGVREGYIYSKIINKDYFKNS